MTIRSGSTPAAWQLVPPLCVALGSLLACGTTHPLELVPRPATGLPDRFVADSAWPPVTAPGPTCTAHLRDPRAGVRLALMWSAWTTGTGATLVGDYEVAPVGSYGLRANELLRLDCTNGRAQGSVPRDR
jgi:hypothetical protein